MSKSSKSESDECGGRRRAIAAAPTCPTRNRGSLPFSSFCPQPGCDLASLHIVTTFSPFQTAQLLSTRLKDNSRPTSASAACTDDRRGVQTASNGERQIRGKSGSLESIGALLRRLQAPSSTASTARTSGLRPKTCAPSWPLDDGTHALELTSICRGQKLGASATRPAGRTAAKRSQVTHTPGVR